MHVCKNRNELSWSKFHVNFLFSISCVCVSVYVIFWSALMLREQAFYRSCP